MAGAVRRRISSYTPLLTTNKGALSGVVRMNVVPGPRGSARCAAVLFVCASAACADGIQFEKAEVDLGVVKAAGTVQHRFLFPVGRVPVEIVHVRPSCACLPS